MISPIAKELTAPAPTAISVAPEPASVATDGSAVLPEGVGGAAGSSASRLMCCEPPAIAICILPQSCMVNSRDASSWLRDCKMGACLPPARMGWNFVVDVRLNAEIHPASSQGAGG